MKIIGTIIAIIMGYIGIWFIDIPIFPMPSQSVFFILVYYLFFIIYLFFVYSVFDNNKLITCIIYILSYVLLIDILRPVYSTSVLYSYSEELVPYLEKLQEIPIVVYFLFYGIIFDIIGGVLNNSKEKIIKYYAKFSGIILSGAIFFMAYIIQEFLPIWQYAEFGIGNKFAIGTLFLVSCILYFSYRYLVKYQTIVTILYYILGIVICLLNYTMLKNYNYNHDINNYEMGKLDFVLIIILGFLFDINKYISKRKEAIYK